MKADVMLDVFFILGLAGLGFGVYDLFGVGWSAISVSVIILTISIYGTIKT